MFRQILGIMICAAIAGSASADDLTDCTRKVLGNWLGEWSCSEHYMDVKIWNYRIRDYDDRLEATTDGMRAFLVEDGAERHTMNIDFPEGRIRFQDVSADGAPDGAARQSRIKSCQGPDDNGFSVVTTSFTFENEGATWQGRGELISSKESTRNTLEVSPDGENWFWAREEVCVRREAR